MNTYKIKFNYIVNTEVSDIYETASYLQEKVETKLQSDKLLDNAYSATVVVDTIVESPFVELTAKLITDKVLTQQQVESYIDTTLNRLPSVDKQYTWEEVFENASVTSNSDIILTSYTVEVIR